MTEPDLHRPSEVAERLGYHVKTIRNMCADGQLPGVVITYGPKGRANYRIPEASVVAWVRRNTAPVR